MKAVDPGVGKLRRSAYQFHARAYHLRRIWAAGMAAIVFTLLAVVPNEPLPGLGAAAGVSVIVAGHAVWRRSRPGSVAWDAMVLDTTMILVFVALLRPPITVLGAAILYTAIPAALFLDARLAGWMVSYGLIGSVGVRWAFPPVETDRTDMSLVALLLLVAGVPSMAWAVRTLFQAIADGRRTVLDLDAASARFERLFDRSVVPMFRSTIEGRLLDTNAAMLAAFSAPDAAALGTRGMPELYVDPGARSTLIERLLGSGEARGFETRLRRWDGTEFWVRISALLTNGTIEGILEDITVEKALHHESLVAEAIFEQIASAVVVADTTGRVTMFNRAAEVLYGIPRDEAIGMLARDLTTHDDPALAKHVAEAARGLAGRWVGDVVVHRLDGQERQASMSVARINHDMPDGFAKVLTDVSDRRQAEHDARAQGELAHAVLESVPFPVAVLDPLGTIVAVNGAWRGFAEANGGDPARTGVGMNYLEVCDAAAQDRTASVVGALIRRVLAGSVCDDKVEYPCHSPDEERWFRMVAAVVPEVGAVVSHWDVTGEHRMQTWLESVVEAKDEFLASVAHHLRTPLTAVVGFADLLRTEAVDEAERSMMLDVVADEARVVADLVEDLMLAGRLDSETITWRSEEVPVASVVAQVVGPVQRASGIPIDVALPEGLVVQGDSLRIRQILRNLMANAVRHGAAPFGVEASSDGVSATVVVVDRGGGAPGLDGVEDFVPYTSKRDGTQPSTVGLGLHVAQRLARHMGGELSYRRVGAESRFSLTLPLSSPSTRSPVRSRAGRSVAPPVDR